MAGQIINPDRMRVAHLTECSCGGVRRHLRYVLPELSARGIQTDLVISTLRAEPDLAADLACYRQLGCRVHTCEIPHLPRPFTDRRLVSELAEVFAGWNTQLLHTHSTKAGLLGNMLCRRTGLPAVHTPHAFFFQRFPAGSWRRQLAVAVEKHCSRHVSRGICVSELEKELALEFCGLAPGKVTLARNALPADFSTSLYPRAQAQKQLQLDSARLQICFIGRLCRQKGPELLLRAVSALATDIKEMIHLNLIGTGPEQQKLQRQTRNSGLTELITWHGYVPEAERLLQAFDLAVMPSRYESLAYCMLQALAAGVPLIVSSLPENLPEPELAELLPQHIPEDAESLAATITRLVRDDELRTHLSHATPDLLRTKFSLAEQADTIIAAYNDVL